MLVGLAAMSGTSIRELYGSNLGQDINYSCKVLFAQYFHPNSKNLD
jgi:hypothetical protein